MATSFFGGEFFGGEFFNTPVSPPVVGASVTPAGRSTKRKRRVIIGDRLFEVDSLKDVESLLKRVVRDEPERVTRAAKARIRVVDRVSARLDKEPPVVLPIVSQDADWSALWDQLAAQERAYADELIRVLRAQDEDDVEAILLLH